MPTELILKDGTRLPLAPFIGVDIGLGPDSTVGGVYDKATGSLVITAKLTPESHEAIKTALDEWRRDAHKTPIVCLPSDEQVRWVPFGPPKMGDRMHAEWIKHAQESMAAQVLDSFRIPKSMFANRECEKPTNVSLERAMVRVQGSIADEQIAKFKLRLDSTPRTGRMRTIKIDPIGAAKQTQRFNRSRYAAAVGKYNERGVYRPRKVDARRGRKAWW